MGATTQRAGRAPGRVDPVVTARYQRADPAFGDPSRVHAISTIAGRDGSLRRLEIASLLWNAGEQVYLVGLIVYAFRLGGPAAVAVLGILQAGPAVVLVPLILRVSHPVRTERVLSVVVGVRAIAVGAAATVLAGGGPAWLVFAAAAVDAVAASAARPARSSLAPRLARSTEELVASNVSISTGRSVAGLVGPALAAVILATR